MPTEETAPSPSKSSTEYKLYLMRHGPAAERGTEYPDDSKRPLTPDGKRKMQEISKGLKRLGVTLDWIVTSPLVRAAETAQIVAASLDPGAPLDATETLSPGGPPEALISYLAKHGSRRRVLLVGHEPDLGMLAARLIGAGRHANMAFKKGGCCLIRFEEFPPKSPGELTWWLSPRVLGKLG